MLRKSWDSFNIKTRSPIDLLLGKTVVKYVSDCVIANTKIESAVRAFAKTVAEDYFDQTYKVHEFEYDNQLLEAEIATASMTIASCWLDAQLSKRNWYTHNQWCRLEDYMPPEKIELLVKSDFYKSLEGNIAVSPEDLTTIYNQLSGSISTQDLETILRIVD